MFVMRYSSKSNFTQTRIKRGQQNTNKLNHLKRFCLLLDLPWHYGFSCASSNHETACMRNHISCKQRVSRQCAKVCDISDCLDLWKKSCIDCMPRVFHQNVASCVSWDNQHGCMNRCTGHSWNSSPLNVLKYGVWVRHLLWRKRYTGCKEMVFPRNEWAGASWDFLPLYRNSRTACNYKAFLLNGFACAASEW